MQVEFHPRVASDPNAATIHYNGIRPGLGDVLRREVHAAIGRIVENPLQFPLIERSSMRRCLVHRFPYSVLFRMPNNDTVRVLLIRHHRRDPDLGSSRR